MSVDRAAARLHVSRLVEVGRYADARSALSTAIANEPDDPQLHGLLAQTYLGLGDTTAALAAASKMVALEPDDEWGHRLCSVALEKSGRRHEALGAAAESVRLAPDRWQTHARFAGAALDVSGRLVDALSAAERATKLAPNEPDAHHVLGLVHHERNDVEAAQAAYRRALALDPGHAGARNNLAVLDGGLRLGKQTRGFLAALRSAPDSELIQRNLEGFLPSLFLRLWLAFGGGLVVSLLVTIHGDAPNESDPGVASYAVLALLAIGCGAYFRSLVGHLPPGVLRELWRRNRRSFLVWWELLATLVMVAGVAVVSVVPGSGEFGVGMLRPLFLGLIIIFISSFVQRERR